LQIHVVPKRRGMPKVDHRKNLTPTLISGLKPAAEGKRYQIMDAQVPGFGVRVTDTGNRTFILRTRYPGASVLAGGRSSVRGPDAHVRPRQGSQMAFLGQARHRPGSGGGKGTPSRAPKASDDLWISRGGLYPGKIAGAEGCNGVGRFPKPALCARQRAAAAAGSSRADQEEIYDQHLRLPRASGTATHRRQPDKAKQGADVLLGLSRATDAQSVV
jgi:hypothetical protein